MSDDELDDEFNSTGITNDQNKKSPRERLDTAIKKSKEIKQRWEKVNEKFENPYNPSYFDKEKDKEAYDLEVTGYQAFEISKRGIAFNEYTFDRTISRLNSLVNNAAEGGPLETALATDFSALYSNEQSFMTYYGAISSEIEALNLGNAQQKKLAKQKSTQLDNLETLKGLMNEYKNKLLLIENARQAVANPEAASEKSKKALEELKITAESFKKDFYDEGVSDDIAPDVIVDEFLKDKLFYAYSDYVKSIGKINGVYAVAESVEDSFADLVDYVKLDADAKQMSQFADIIANPMSIYEMSRRIQASLTTVNAKRKELHLKGLNKFKRDILDVDELFQKMLDMGVYFDPEHIDAFKKDGTLPPNFIDAMTGEAIKNTDPKYNQVVALIEQEEKLRGVTFSNKPVQYTKPEEKKAETETPAETAEDEDDDFEETVIYDITTEFNTFPDDIKNKLKQAHAAAMLDGATTDIQEWMLEDPDAALIISGKTPAVKKTEKTDTEETEDKELDLITAENPKSFEGAPAEFKQQFDELKKQKWNLAPDKKTYISEEGEVSKRVSDLKEGEIPNTDATKAAIDRGNFLDEIIRSFATPEANNLSFKDQIINAKKIGKTDSEVKMYIANYLRGLSGTYIKKYKLKIGDSGVTEYKLQIDDGYFESMADVLLTLAIKYKDFNWYTSVPTMIGTLMGETFGGTIDLMLERNGKYTIIDLKTSNKPRVVNKELYDRNDQIQQNAYAELWEQITGKPISRIRILNLITTMTGPTSRRLDEVKIYKFKDSSNKDAILTPIPRVSIAELKGYTPEGTETPTEAAPTTDTKADIERRRQEDLDNSVIFLINDGTYGGSKDFSLREYLDISEKENGKQFAIVNWKYINVNGTGVFINRDGGQIYIVPNNTYNKNKPRIVKLFFNKGTKRIDISNPNINTSILKQQASSDGVNYDSLLKEVESVITPADAELAALEQPVAPTTDTRSNEQKIADYRAEEKAELAKAGIDLTKFEGTYGDNKGKMPDDLYAIYKPIYDKYDKLITPLLPDTGKKETKQVDWNAVIDRATSAKEVDKIMDQIYAANASTPELIDRALVKKESFPKPDTKLTVKELKDALVQRLQAGETITGTISKPTGTPNNVFEFIEEGKPTVTFYNTGVAQITMDDLNKTATLRLVEKIVTEDKRQYYNVVEVYIGDKLIGNVQTTDFKANDLTNNIIMAATPGDLMNNFSSYIANKTIRSKFKYKAKDGTEQIYTFDEVIDLTKRTLSNMKITPEEKAVYLKGIDDLVNAELGMVEKKVSPEEKESAQNVIDDAADKVVDIDGASVNEAIDQTQQEVDDEFDNSLGCK